MVWHFTSRLPPNQVANTYLLSTGLPTESPDHASTMAAFSLDLIALCENLPAVGPVSVRIGLHCGPVTAGIIGKSRRFFRVFGDTGACGPGIGGGAGERRGAAGCLHLPLHPSPPISQHGLAHDVHGG